MLEDRRLFLDACAHSRGKRRMRGRKGEHYGAVAIGYFANSIYSMHKNLARRLTEKESVRRNKVPTLRPALGRMVDIDRPIFGFVERISTSGFQKQRPLLAYLIPPDTVQNLPLCVGES